MIVLSLQRLGTECINSSLQVAFLFSLFSLDCICIGEEYGQKFTEALVHGQVNNEILGISLPSDLIKMAIPFAAKVTGCNHASAYFDHNH